MFSMNFKFRLLAETGGKNHDFFSAILIKEVAVESSQYVVKCLGGIRFVISNLNFTEIHSWILKKAVNHENGVQ